MWLTFCHKWQFLFSGFVRVNIIGGSHSESYMNEWLADSSNAVRFFLFVGLWGWLARGFWFLLFNQQQYSIKKTEKMEKNWILKRGSSCWRFGWIACVLPAPPPSPCLEKTFDTRSPKTAISIHLLSETFCIPVFHRQGEQVCSEVSNPYKGDATRFRKKNTSYKKKNSIFAL